MYDTAELNNLLVFIGLHKNVIMYMIFMFESNMFKLNTLNLMFYQSKFFLGQNMFLPSLQ